MTRRDIVVGDVHGCVVEHEELIERLGPGPGDRLFYLGDLVDRGPDSLRVVRTVAALLQKFPGSVAIAGNHEEKALRYRDHGRVSQLKPWAAEATRADWDFLESLPLIVRPRAEVVLVHGGFFPGFFMSEGAVGEVSPGWRKEPGKRADRLRRFLRVRDVGANGAFLSLDHGSAAAVHWSSVYDGREGPRWTPQIRPLMDTSKPAISRGCPGRGFGVSWRRYSAADRRESWSASFADRT